jgi:N-terminal or F0 domain of Talin-head FERM
MATLSLKISIVEQGVTKTMQFEPATTVYDACRIIREKITEANLGQREYNRANSCISDLKLRRLFPRFVLVSP